MRKVVFHVAARRTWRRLVCVGLLRIGRRRFLCDFLTHEGNQPTEVSNLLILLQPLLLFGKPLVYSFVTKYLTRHRQERLNLSRVHLRTGSQRILGKHTRHSLAGHVHDLLVKVEISFPTLGS